MKPTKFLRFFLLSAGSSLLAISSASAQTTYTWDTTPGSVGAGDSAITGGTGAWNTTNGNWTTDAGVNNAEWVNAGSAPFNNAVFGGTAGTVTLGEAISLRNLTINTANYVITGQTLNFTTGTITIPNALANVSNVVLPTSSQRIQSDITGAPSVNANALGSNRAYAFSPAANGSMSIGAVTGAAGNSAGIMIYEGGAGSTSTLASSFGPKTVFQGNATSQWTVTGTVESRGIQINSGIVVVTGTLSNAASQTRSVALGGGVLHYNSPGAVRDRSLNAGGGGTNMEGGADFIIAGGSIDQTSGAAITTSTHNPEMTWAGNWTFIGSNGATSNLYLGNGRVVLNQAVRTVTVTNANTTLSVGGEISNGGATAGGLTKAGAGTLELRGGNSYTGATSINAGTLAITGTGSINTSSGISVAAGGTLRYNSSTALNKVTLNGTGTDSGQRAVLSGTGPIGVAVTLDSTGDVLSPGNSPGIQTYTTGQTWASFSYDWEVNDFTGTTAGTAFDQIGITGGLALSGGSGSYILNVLGLTAGDVEGSTPNFSEINRSWTILTTTTGITSFDAANWTINTAGFSSPDAGTWALNESSGNLVLSYTAIPEPSAALLGGLGLLGLLRRRR